MIEGRLRNDKWCAIGFHSNGFFLDTEGMPLRCTLHARTVAEEYTPNEWDDLPQPTALDSILNTDDELDETEFEDIPEVGEPAPIIDRHGKVRLEFIDLEG